jgi:hypothetical protein
MINEQIKFKWKKTQLSIFWHECWKEKKHQSIKIDPYKNFWNKF